MRRWTRSIRVRLTISYALSATTTLLVLFTVGHLLLENELEAGLNRLLDGEYVEINARLGGEVSHLDNAALARRMAEISAYSSALFYIEIEAPGTGTVYRSPNLLDHEIPDIKGRRVYDARVDPIGDMHAHEYLLPPFDITIATPVGQLRDSLDAYRKVCLALLVTMLVVSATSGYGLAKFILSPLRVIADTARRMRSGNLSERIAVSSVKDEIADLATLLNQTFDRIETAFDQVRRFSDEASHELKTPLSLIRLHAEKMLADAALPRVFCEALGEQLEEVHRLNQIIDELLFLSRAEADAVGLDQQPQSPSDLLADFEIDASVLAEHHGCRFSVIHKGSGLVSFDAKWIRQVLLNGLTNAINVSPENGLIVLRSHLDQDRWLVQIEDEGPGLSPEDLKRMFDRFTRFGAPKGGDRGSGLGLAICKKIVELHRGQIYAFPNPIGRGLVVAFNIPVVGGLRTNGSSAPSKAAHPIKLA